MSPLRAKLGRWLVVAPFATVLALGCCFIAQTRIDASRDVRFDEELLYLPNEKLLNHFTAGLNGVVADLLWLQCIQYTAKEFRSQEHKFTWLEHMANTVTRLDPDFTGAYQYGGTLLAAIDNDGGAMELLERGIVARPDSWELPFEVAKVYILNRRDEAGSPAAASYFLTMTAERTPEHAEYFADWAQEMQVQHDMLTSGKHIWRDVLETSSDEFMRELAKRKLLELQLHETCGVLTQAAGHYEAALGETPPDVAALAVAGFITAVPEDPAGGSFLITNEGEVKSTTLLDGQVEERLRGLREAVSRFEEKCGAYPASLEHLVQEELIRSIPAHPYPGGAWQYDSGTGSVESRLG